MKKISALIIMALALSASAFAGDGLVVRDPVARSGVVVLAQTTMQDAEIVITGTTAIALKAQLGGTRSSPSSPASDDDAKVVLSLNTSGDVRVLTAETLDAASDSVTALKGSAALEAVNTTDNDTLVVRGKAALELYRYLQYGRRLSIRIGEDASSIVGSSIVCQHVYDVGFNCSLDLKEDLKEDLN